MDAVTVAIFALGAGIVLYFVVKGGMGGASGSSGNQYVDALAQAIASAENSNTAWNNPGDLTQSFGFATNGTVNSAGVLQFATSAGGWNALYAQIQAILDGTSRYSLDTSISDFASGYTGGDNAAGWAATVAGALGVSTDTTLGQVLNPSASSSAASPDGSQTAENDYVPPPDDSGDDEDEDFEDEENG
jgi:hypothetical protein